MNREVKQANKRNVFWNQGTALKFAGIKGTRAAIFYGELGIKSKKIKGSWEHAPPASPPPREGLSEVPFNDPFHSTIPCLSLQQNG